MGKQLETKLWNFGISISNPTVSLLFFVLIVNTICVINIYSNKILNYR